MAINSSLFCRQQFPPPSYCISLFNINSMGYFLPGQQKLARSCSIFSHLLILNDSSSSIGHLSLQFLLHLGEIILLNKIIFFFCALYNAVPSVISEGEEGETRTLPANPIPDYKLLFLSYLFRYLSSFILEFTLKLLDEGTGFQGCTILDFAEDFPSIPPKISSSHSNSGPCLILPLPCSRE